MPVSRGTIPSETRDTRILQVDVQPDDEVVRGYAIIVRR